MSIHAELLGHFGGDLDVVNAARVSMDKASTVFREQDAKLIEMLAANAHCSPFRHVYFKFRIRAPEFLARQAYKHVVGISATADAVVTNDSGWNEMSMRYVRMKEFYEPDQWRCAPKEARQGSATDRTFSPEEQLAATTIYKDALEHVKRAYLGLLEMGVAKEMARMICPLSVETQFIWTLSLQAVAHFVKLRHAPEAQWEIQELARQIEEQVKPLVPVSWAALMKSNCV